MKPYAYMKSCYYIKLFQRLAVAGLVGSYAVYGIKSMVMIFF